MLMAHGDYTLPHNVPSNEYLQLEEQKFSKSKKHGVWVEDMLEEFDGERIRYYLTAIAPETRDSNFTIDEFVKSNNDALSDVFGNLCHRVFTFTDRYCDGQVPPAPQASVAADALLAAVAGYRNRWRESLERVHLREAQGIALDLAREGNRYFDTAQPWKTRKSDMARCAGDLRACLELVAALGVLFVPFLPTTAQKLRAAFGADGDVTPADLDALGSWRLTEGASITPPGVLFPKLEAESHPG